ncbi:hypothetical protein PHJA_002305500 [Phtheirospermum japonicum]|uniref:ZF-HD dimerization-type domain-containing protein n=1 Tax=Phtheirospermum japonicum TaxID=374723 RepID=A0A830D330_9LAMI|nr:hypothetical protein PHJA_002305500 [Phtheirospermum japonicum]
MFEPSGPNESPEAMVCTACRCHRNFHRRVVVDLPPSAPQNDSLPPSAPREDSFAPSAGF